MTKICDQLQNSAARNHYNVSCMRPFDHCTCIKIYVISSVRKSPSYLGTSIFCDETFFCASWSIQNTHSNGFLHIQKVTNIHRDALIAHKESSASLLFAAHHRQKLSGKCVTRKMTDNGK